MLDTDATLRRIERTAIVVCLALAAIAAIVTRFDMRAPLGVLGGGLIILVSYATIRASAGALVASLTGPGAAPPRRRPWVTAAKLAARYALLALLAYVMIARLRLHPVGLLVGASSVAAAATIEAVRLLRKNAGTSTLDR